MSKLLLCIFASFMGIFVAIAQSPCGNDILAKRWQQQFPYILQKAAQEKANWLLYNQNLRYAKTIVSGSDTIYEIPLVFHIVHTGDTIGSEFNPSNKTIDSIVYFLNQTFAATWPSFVDTSKGGTRMPIRFVLAKRDPNCNPTNGINRVNGTVYSKYLINGICPAGSVPGPSDAEIKKLSYWPPRDYLNIWVVNKIEGGTLGGYAPWPWYAAEIIDGVVITAANIKRDASGEFYFGLAHEIGHSFGLYHTFQGGCDGTASCLLAGDQICDTEPHLYTSFSCDTGKTNSCTGAKFNGVEHNFMNYSTCANRFTKDQAKRSLYTLFQYRMGLVASLGGTAPDPTFVAPKVNCPVDLIYIGNAFDSGPCNFSFANIQTSSLGYNGDGNQHYIDRTCMQEAAIVNEGDTVAIMISTRKRPQNVTAWIDYNDNGIYNLSELVFTHSGTLDTENHMGTIVIPKKGVAFNTNLRMRIMGDYLSIPSACGDLLYGQAEDYTIFIKGTIVGIDETKQNKQSSIRLYPNPAHNSLFIDTKAVVNIQIMACDGRLLLQKKATTEIDISTLPEGLYFAKLYDSQSGESLGTQKFIKN